MISAKFSISKVLFCSLLFCCSFLLAIPTYAQSATPNPTKVTFTASPDHALVVDTIAILIRYDLVVFQGSTAIATISLGKPTPAATTNEIIAAFSGAALPKNTVLTAFVDAIGPYGSTRSVTPSNPFVFVAAPRAASNPKMEP